MARPLAYVETSVFVAYFDVRPDPQSVAQRFWTRHWWRQAPRELTLRTSDAVVDELAAGSRPGHVREVRMARRLPRTAITHTVRGLTRIYLERLPLPRNPVGDALHLALATVHEAEFLVTWNFTHLIDPLTYELVIALNARLGYVTPRPVTPQMFVDRSRP